MKDGAIEFVVEIAEALLGTGQPANLVQPQAVRMAEANGIAEPRLAVLPSLILATAGLGKRVELGGAPSDPDLRLDQTAEVQP